MIAAVFGLIIILVPLDPIEVSLAVFRACKLPMDILGYAAAPMREEF
jgi:hypothetical protein